MNVVILAAGRGSRLDGVAAPFWKPLFVVNGEPLVVRVVRQAMSVSQGRVVVVVSPENALPISQVLHANDLDHVDVVVQPSPRGPGSAFLRAVPLLARGLWTMILCADNVISDADVLKCAESGGPLVIGTRSVEDPDEALRFTLVAEDGRISEGMVDHTMVWKCDGRFRAWVGPLVVDAAPLASILERITPDGELKIGEWLERYRDGRITPVLIDCDAYDIGSPGDTR